MYMQLVVGARHRPGRAVGDDHSLYRSRPTKLHRVEAPGDFRPLLHGGRDARQHDPGKDHALEPVPGAERIRSSNSGWRILITVVGDAVVARCAGFAAATFIPRVSVCRSGLPATGADSRAALRPSVLDIAFCIQQHKPVTSKTPIPDGAVGAQERCGAC